MIPFLRDRRPASRLARRGTSLVLLALACALVASPVFALDPSKSLKQYVRQSWGVDDGLPQSSVTALAQTRDGYVWLATLEGLVRFDGVRFVTFNQWNSPGLEFSWLEALLADRQDVLWAGTRGGGLIRRQNGVFRTFTTRDGLPSNFVSALAEGPDGSIWIGTEDAGVARWTGSTFERFDAARNLPALNITSLAVDRQGVVWITSSDAGFYRLEHGRVARIGAADGLHEVMTRAVYFDRRGTVWLGTETGLYKQMNGRFVSALPRGWPTARVDRILEDRDGALWFGSSAGLGRLTADRVDLYSDADGLSHKVVSALLEDTEGNIWVGTENGLNRIRDGRFVSMSRAEGLPNDFVWTVYEDRAGLVWAGIDSGGVMVSQDGKFVRHPGLAALDRRRVRTIRQDNTGAMWLGIWDGGLYRFADGRLTEITDPQGRRIPGDIWAVYNDRSGRVWLGTVNGLRIVQGNRAVAPPDAMTPPKAPARTIFEDRQGTLWVGTRGGGLCRLDATRFDCHVVNHSGQDMVQGLGEDSDGTLWIATRGGVTRLKDGTYRNFNRRDGLFDDVVHTVLDDGHGYLWFSSNRGIFRVRKQDFDDLDRGALEALRVDVYGRADGLLSVEANSGSPGSIRTRDGKLWFATMGGVAVIDPGLIQNNTRVPPVVIETATVNGRAVSIDNGLSLPAGASDLQIEYAALSLSAPQRVSFKYRLEGLDKDWVDPGTRRTAVLHQSAARPLHVSSDCVERRRRLERDRSVARGRPAAALLSNLLVLRAARSAGDRRQRRGDWSSDSRDRAQSRGARRPAEPRTVPRARREQLRRRRAARPRPDLPLREPRGGANSRVQRGGPGHDPAGRHRASGRLRRAAALLRPGHCLAGPSVWRRRPFPEQGRRLAAHRDGRGQSLRRPSGWRPGPELP